MGCAYSANRRANYADSKDSTLCLDGSFFDVSRDHQAEQAHKRFIRSRSIRRTAGKMAIEPAAIACLCYMKNRLHAFRDLSGLKPLYFAKSRSVVAIASERKALRRVGLKNVERIEPGFLYTFSKLSYSKSRLAILPHPREEKMTMQRASTQLRRLLVQSIERITKHVDRVAVAFSGGLDSALTALLAKRMNIDVELISVGLTSSPELMTADKFASQLDLPHTIVPFTPDSLEEYVRRV